MSKSRIIAIVLAVLFLVYAGTTATVVKEGQEALLTGEKVFDPATVASNFWKNNSKEYFKNNCYELSDLIKEANGDFVSISKKGHYSMGDSGELSFIVKGSGTVTEVKNKLKSGYVVFDLDNNTSEDVKTRLQIGPVFKGSAVRDSINLISYKDYKNQIEWAQVSVSLHNLILNEVLSKVDFDNLTGKKIEFIGCFTVGSGALRITPVELTVK